MTAFGSAIPHGAGSLADRWRAEAEILRHRGAVAQAEALESCAIELEQFERQRAIEALTLEQAESESGYSYSALEKMIRRGELVNVGKRGSPRVRRGDLPKKPTDPALRHSGSQRLRSKSSVAEAPWRSESSGHILCDTMSALCRLIVKALRLATPTVEQCAEELGLSTSALRRYRLGNRQPNPGLANQMAGLLRRRAAAMVKLADQLEATTMDKEDQDAS